MNRRFGALSSSVDPQNLSLTVESAVKFILGLVPLYATSQGLDVASATTQVQAIINVGTQAVAAAFSLYSAIMVGYGLVRKFIVLVTTR